LVFRPKSSILTKALLTWLLSLGKEDWSDKMWGLDWDKAQLKMSDYL
jgi:hypothetical protein